MLILLVQWWIVLSAALSFAGWTLSWAGMLNARGYVVVFIAFGILMLLLRCVLPARLVRWRAEVPKLFHRFRRLAPLLFLTMALLSALGGILYEPMHGDSQSYRVPRVLHWLWENGWHWIHTGDVRMNVVAPGCEWLWAPGFFALPGQRWLFFYNSVSLWLLPGLLFALFKELGVRRRIAWWWMWVLPAGYSYALQAGGISTDAYATIYVLAAVVFALRARKSFNLRELLLSMVAAALMTGAKQTNLLLLPLWFVPFAMNWRILWRHSILTFGAALLAISASFLPISYLNIKYAGNWQGFTDTRTFVPHSPLYGVIGNAFALPAQNLLPPVFPLANKWNAAMERFRKTPIGVRFEGFEDFGHLYRMPSDTTGGLGLVLCGLVLWSAVSCRASERCIGQRTRRENILNFTFRWGPWLLLVIFMAKVGTATNARYLAPMYPFLLVPILQCARAQYRRRSWRILAYSASIVTILLLVSSRQRPLFPVRTICSAAEKIFPSFEGIRKVRNAYAYFQEHSELMTQIAASIPKEEKVVGYATEVGFLESALWMPFGSKRVHRLTGKDTREEMTGKNIRYVMIEETILETTGVGTVEEWITQLGGKTVATFPFRRLGPEARVETVYLVRLI